MRKNATFNKFMRGPIQYDLQAIAEDIIRRSLDEDYRPNATKIFKEYRLTKEAQLQRVKKLAKAFAKDTHGVMWGYQPSQNVYRTCPDNSPAIAQEMIDFVFETWGNSGKNASVTLDAAIIQRYIPKRKGQGLVKRADNFVQDIIELGREAQITEQALPSV